MPKATPTMNRKKAVELLDDLTGRLDAVIESSEETRSNLNTECLEAVKFAVHYMTDIDDPTLANMLLITTGTILGALSAVCCCVGSIYILMGSLESSYAMMPYAFAPALAALLAFRSVRKGKKA